VEAGVPAAPVLADAAYGNDGGFRARLEALGLAYAVGVQSSTSLWRLGCAPLPPRRRPATGRPPKLLRRDARHQPLSVRELALCLGAKNLRAVSWREGMRGAMRSRFTRLRVRSAHRDYWRDQPHPGTVFADRVAARRGRAHQVLALQSARLDQREGDRGGR